MSENAKVIIVLIVSVALGITVIVCTAIIRSSAIDREAIRAGLEQVDSYRSGCLWKKSR